MNGFNFFRSYYDATQHLTDTDQALFYKAIMDYMFTDKEPQLEGALMGFWVLIKPNLDTSKSRSNATKNKSKANQKQIKPKTKHKSSPPKEKEKEKEKDIGEDRRLNTKAFNMWCEYKGKKYSTQAKTLSKNKLIKQTHNEQMEMVETSIMNSWGGLFEPKKQSTFKSKNEPQVGSIMWQLEQEAKENNYVDVQIENS